MDTAISGYGPVTLDPANEEQCRAGLREYLVKSGYWNIDKNIEELMALDSGVCDRFNYFFTKVPAEAVRPKLLVSGCAVGSELLIARNQYGFKEVHGTDIVPEYVTLAKRRLAGHAGLDVVLYDGAHLPFGANSFTAIASGHIIEHTPSPPKYLREHVRVLAPGGYMFLEFPDRYHPIELHTNLPSAEHLDWPWRDLVLLYRSSRFSPFKPEERVQYRIVRKGLRPISVALVEKWLKAIDAKHCDILHNYQPAPGFTRLIIHKNAL